LRGANGSRECAPDDRLRDEAIHSFFVLQDGLLRFARNDAVKSRYTFAVSRRDASELLHEPPSTREGAGNAGCALHPRSRVQKCTKETHTSIQVQRRQSGIPCAMALRLISSSPRRRIRLVTVAAGLMALRSGWIDPATGSLTPATGARTTRFCRTHQRRSSRAQLSLTRDSPCDRLARRRCRVHRIPSQRS
jgi:hypothetical protein